MAKPYASEISRFAETFAWAIITDISPLRRAVRTASLSSLVAVGSGGSLTTAHALVGLHRKWASRFATVATPLDAISESTEASTSIWLLSAGGGNVDILAAFESLVAREPRQLAVLCGRGGSSLAASAEAHPYSDLLVFEPPAGKDGFLATNSLLGFVTLLSRAYVSEFAGETAWDETAAAIERLLRSDELLGDWQRITEPLWRRETTLVLYGSASRVGAVDVESKFIEAALGNVQLADYRNFAHGRHHWLAKKGEVTGVLAFVSPEDRRLAERTLALIPPEIPQARIIFDMPGGAVPIASLVVALYLTAWAGRARGIDPGRPGVPEFGRKLYSLASSSSRTRAGHRADFELKAFAIARKSGFTRSQLEQRGEYDRWYEALVSFERKLGGAQFRGVVLDYDGTVVDSRDRFHPPRQEIVNELVRLADAGAYLAFATGRGASVRRDLQKCLPRSSWSQILIGYYNGAELALLEDDSAPDRGDKVCASLVRIAAALREQPEIAASVKQTERRFQITLEPKGILPENRLWDLAHEVMLASDVGGLKVTRSSHSIDIVAEGVTKLAVLRRLRELVGDEPLLAIGDRGRWPGNDHELLREPYSLSVDEVSVDPTTCWNLAPVGQRGLAVTIGYLKRLNPTGVGLSFKLDESR